MEKPVITVSGISKKYNIGIELIRKRNGGLKDALLAPYRALQSLSQPFIQDGKNAFWALKDISFDVYHGEKIGIIGLNGAGKSTLLKILSRLVYPTEGVVKICGRVTSLLEVGTGFNPNLTGRKNIYLNASLYGLERAEIDEKFDDIVEFSGIGKFLDTPVKYYSSGMYMRLAFSVAAHLDPDILLLDEVLAVGDLAFQQKCLKRVEGLASGGRTILFVSHSLGEVVRFCERVIWLENGRIRFDGEATEGVKLYQEEQMPKSETVKVESRKDRIGTGLARFTGVTILDEDQNPCETVRTGQDIHIALDYKFQERLSNPASDVFVCIVIENDRKQRIFGLPSEVLPVDLTKLSPTGQLICKIKRLPLVPGIYEITMSLLIDRQLVDKIVNARKLMVLDGDFYGTGKLPLSSYGRVCVDFDWASRTS
ncbi:MAG: ABC transporter ATP-binding protein [Nitrospirae bacterium]|nr:ABC transporter ATP-binding protein [Nitrospirota bacterium]